jgi:hypothetical protein
MPNLVISPPVVLESQRAAADEEDAVDIGGMKITEPFGHCAKPSAVVASISQPLQSSSCLQSGTERHGGAGWLKLLGASKGCHLESSKPEK